LSRSHRIVSLIAAVAAAVSLASLLVREASWTVLAATLLSGALSATLAWLVVWRIHFRSLKDSQRARERSYVEAVGAIVTAADARDQETGGHSFRVALYAVELARTLGIEGAALKAIEWGALLHDVGKMVVPDHILRKGSPLTDEEWLIMKQHPNWGYEMLAEVSFLQSEALDLIYSHHERWDGAGYPRGLAREDIPLGARVFAVVDTYDAITSDRPYRKARPHTVAIAELQRVAGQQLDPRVVKAFQEIHEVELKRLRMLCRRVQPGLRLPADMLDRLSDSREMPVAHLP
jgi:putative nucleotidyltransferase with HDIG domain